MKSGKTALALVMALALFGCDAMPDWMGKAEKPPLPGERVEIIPSGEEVKPDPKLAAAQVVLPAPRDNDSWKEPGANAQYQNLALSGKLNEIMIEPAGQGGDGFYLLQTEPVIVAGRVFTLDAANTVTSFNAANFKQKLWSVQIKPPGEKENVPGGGIAYGGGKIYVATGFGSVVALSAKDGTEIWRKALNLPMRKGPRVLGNKIFVATANNELYALSASDGSLVWKHSGAPETAGVLGSAVPALRNNLVVMAYSSGEVFGINADRGSELWSEMLAAGSKDTESAGSMNDVDAQPVIADDMVYIVSHGGVLAAFNIASGFRVWEAKISSVETPWIGGDFLFLVTTENKVVAVERKTGKVKWATELATYAKEEDKSRISWSGPIMARGRLLVSGSAGELEVISPQNGRIERRISIPERVFTPPIVVNGKIYLFSDRAEIISLK